MKVVLLAVVQGWQEDSVLSAEKCWCDVAVVLCWSAVQGLGCCEPACSSANHDHCVLPDHGG